jgi:hypothetical protein
VVVPEIRICPGARAPEGVVGNRRRTVEQRAILPVRLEALVRAGPYASTPGDLALPVVAPPAGTVSLVLDALALGAQIRDLGNRAVPAVPAVEERDLDRLFGDVGDMAEVRPLGGPVEAARGPEAGRARIERECVNRPVGAVGEWDPARPENVSGIAQASS